MNTLNASEAILNIAETLIQTKGYNAFSFRDIALAVGIKTSSIHYHFPTKAELGKAVVARHIDILHAGLVEILHDPHMNCRKKMGLFLDGMIAKTYASDRKMCLGGILAADILTLPEIVQVEVQTFFKRIEKWLEELLLQGKAKGEFHLKGSTKVEAEFILSLLEGALLLARVFHHDGKLLIARNQIEARLW